MEVKKEQQVEKVDIEFLEGPPQETQTKLTVEKQKEYEEVRQRIQDCIQRIDAAYMELCQLLHKVYSEKLWQVWGYNSFDQYVEKELPYKMRKVYYLISIWDWFAVKVGDPTVMEKVAGLGWSKVKELVGVVTAENVDEWVEIARRVDGRQLAELCKQALIEKERQAGAAPLPHEENVAAVSKLIKTINFSVTPEQYETIQTALEAAKRITGSNKKSYLITMICLDFAAQHAAAHSGKVSVLKHMESMLGVELIAIDAFTKKVLVGEELLERLIATKMH